MALRIDAGRPAPLGATADAHGVNFAVFSAHAEQIDVCLFSPDDGRETNRFSLPERSGDIWHGYIEGLQPGAHYGLRAHGTYAPETGHRFNPSKLLLDPYARALSGPFIDDDALLGVAEDSEDTAQKCDPRDSAASMPKCVVPDPGASMPFTCHPKTQWSQTLIYEAHVKGLTALMPLVPDPLRGTYEGLATEPVIAHLKKLGVTALELLPVQGFPDDRFLLKRGLTNYWGYNTATFFAPEQRYFGPNGAEGFRRMVRRLHREGIEVILDVVYNHTAEGDARGPTLSFRGLDNLSYYRLSEENPRAYVNDTGTGNTVNVAHPQVLRLVMDSLRYWVQEMGVDGFRFDLATVMGRERHGFDQNGGFFDALRQDPVLAQTKLIAEPWDIGPGGYQLGQYPAEFSEWNDAYRDTVRRFWKGEPNSTQELAARLLGSADLFDHSGRRPRASINFLAAHDGFTLADVTAYTKRHNEANGEGNRDGHGANHSDNFGVEGPTDESAIRAARKRRQRNMMATLFMSQGTPMVLAGDEIAHSQKGNNNTYCQDNPLTWLDWAEADEGMTGFVAALSAFRRACPVLRQDYFLHGNTGNDQKAPDVLWRRFEDMETAPDWDDPDLSELCVVLRSAADAPEYACSTQAVVIAINRGDAPKTLVVPNADVGTVWTIEIDTDVERQVPRPVSTRDISVAAHSVVALSADAPQADA